MRLASAGVSQRRWWPGPRWRTGSMGGTSFRPHVHATAGRPTGWGRRGIVVSKDGERGIRRCGGGRRERA